MTFGLDTSVVLRLLTGQPQELAVHALARYQEGIANGDSFYVSDVVASEAYYAIQHHYGKTSQNFAASINTPNIHKVNPGFVDRMLASGYREQGQITLSCEKSFRRLADTEVIS